MLDKMIILILFILCINMVLADNVTFQSDVTLETENIIWSFNDTFTTNKSFTIGDDYLQHDKDKITMNPNQTGVNITIIEWTNYTNNSFDMTTNSPTNVTFSVVVNTTRTGFITYNSTNYSTNFISNILLTNWFYNLNTSIPSTPPPSGGGGGGGLPIWQCQEDVCIIEGDCVEDICELDLDNIILNIGDLIEIISHKYIESNNEIILNNGDTYSIIGSKLTDAYDIIVDVAKTSYSRENNIDTDIIIINNRNVADNGMKLLTYLLSPSGERYKEKTIGLQTIPSTCTDNIFSWYDNLCMGDVNLPPNKLHIIRQVALPEDAENGKWQFVLEMNNGDIVVSDNFNVYARDYSYLIIILILILAYYTSRVKFNKKKREER